MNKIISILLISLSCTFAQNQVVKTSELEMFLFKVGFESLLNSVDVNSKRSEFNEQSIEELHSKITFIMDAVYKDKRILEKSSNDTHDVNVLKENIKWLKSTLLKVTQRLDTIENKQERQSITKIQTPIEEIQKIEEIKKIEVPIILSKQDIYSQKAVVITKIIKVRNAPYMNDSAVVSEIFRDDIIEIESCNQYDWCKIKNEEKYIPKYLIRLE